MLTRCMMRMRVGPVEVEASNAMLFKRAIETAREFLLRPTNDQLLAQNTKLRRDNSVLRRRVKTLEGDVIDARLEAGFWQQWSEGLEAEFLTGQKLEPTGNVSVLVEEEQPER